MSPAGYTPGPRQPRPHSTDAILTDGSAIDPVTGLSWQEIHEDRELERIERLDRYADHGRLAPPEAA